MPVPTPCDRCANKGLECRIYHPDLQSTRAMPGSCGECRLRSHTCGLKSANNGKADKKRRASEFAPNDRRPKILRRSVGGEPARDANHCPIVTCRRSQPFSNKASLLRHVRSAHPLEAQQRITVPNQRVASIAATKATSVPPTGGGFRTFKCPVVGCSVRAMTRVDHFRLHIREKHPESIHAQVLEAFIRKIRISLPSPPSGREYTSDFNKATSGNAPPGAFGHRLASEWDTANAYNRTRIAHAKLIHGKYGVLVPKSCSNCRNGGTACLVYHPNLDGDGRALGTYCGECRNRNVRCEIGPHPFEKILRCTRGILDTPEADSGAEVDTIVVQANSNRNVIGRGLPEDHVLNDEILEIKQEENNQENAPMIFGDDDDDDSVIYGHDHRSPFEMVPGIEDGLADGDNEVALGA